MLTKKEKDEIIDQAFKTITMIFTESGVRPSRELWDISIAVYQAAIKDYVKHMKEIERGK